MCKIMDECLQGSLVDGGEYLRVHLVLLISAHLAKSHYSKPSLVLVIDRAHYNLFSFFSFIKFEIFQYFSSLYNVQFVFLFTEFKFLYNSIIIINIFRQR